MVQLLLVLTSSDWTQFVDKYFRNKAVVKIGFGLRGDFQVLGKTLKEFNNLEERYVLIDTRGRPTSRLVLIIIFTLGVRPFFQNLSKQNNFQLIATCGIVGQAEGIIDDTCLVI